IASGILFTPWVVQTKYGDYGWGHPIIAFLIFALLMWSLAGFGYQIWKCETDTQRRQTTFFLLGIALAIVWGSITNLIIPTLVGSTQFARYGPLGMIFIGIFAIYAIFQYRIFQIRVLTAEIFLELIGVILIVLTFTSSTLPNFIINGSTLIIYGFVAYFLYEELWQRVKQEQKIAKKNAELRRILETKDDFLRMVSHQLRTPMTSLSGFLSMLVDKENETYQVNDQTYQTLIRIYVNTQRLSAVVNDILFTNALNAEKFGINVRETNLQEILEGVLANKRKVVNFYEEELSYTVQGDEFELQGDPVKLKEVFNSILDNAIYYGHSRIEVTLQEEADHICVRVSDDGIGITSEDVSSVWNKFERSEEAKRRSPNSSGLALYVTRETIERHNGSIWFESEGRDEGTTFYVRLPKDGPDTKANTDSEEDHEA
ncbi:MAG: ATP-binding protein, partial [Candidatus Paceibacteria bacterium]